LTSTDAEIALMLIVLLAALRKKTCRFFRPKKDQFQLVRRLYSSRMRLKKNTE